MPSSKKNAAGCGTIRKKTVTKNGKDYTYWEARYTVGYDPGTGKQIQKSITGKTQNEVAKKLKEAMDELLTSLEIACNSIEMIQKGNFTIENYNKSKTECLLEERSKTRARRLKKLEKDDNELGVVNEELRARLQEWRTARFKKDNVPAFKIMHQSTLMAIATHIPKTKSELLRIKGFGEESFKKYGEDILAITAEFTL